MIMTQTLVVPPLFYFPGSTPDSILCGGTIIASYNLSAWVCGKIDFPRFSPARIKKEKRGSGYPRLGKTDMYVKDPEHFMEMMKDV